MYSVDYVMHPCSFSNGGTINLILTLTLLNGPDNPQNCPSAFGFRHPAGWDEDRATVIGNMHKIFGKDRACGSSDILADGQIDRHIQTDILITILPHHSWGRRNEDRSKSYLYLDIMIQHHHHCVACPAIDVAIPTSMPQA